MLVVLLSLVWDWRRDMFRLSGFYCTDVYRVSQHASDDPNTTPTYDHELNACFMQ